MWSFAELWHRNDNEEPSFFEVLIRQDQIKSRLDVVTGLSTLTHIIKTSETDDLVWTLTSKMWPCDLSPNEPPPQESALIRRLVLFDWELVLMNEFLTILTIVNCMIWLWRHKNAGIKWKIFLQKWSKKLSKLKISNNLWKIYNKFEFRN